METNNNFIEYGSALKNWWEFSESDIKMANEAIAKKVRERAWAVGSPVYYMLNGHIIAEYANGKKMIVEKKEGIETERPYNG
jgi:hypothetical protein